MDLRAFIRDIPDFPKPGIVFKDITPLLLDPAALDFAVSSIAEYARPLGVDLVVAAEARGFILGAARRARAGRRASCRPASRASCRRRRSRPSTSSSTASTRWRCTPTRWRDGARVLLHDDLLATGGTARALCELVEGAGAVVAGCAFLVELSFLGGREKLAPYDVHTLIAYDAE